MPLSFVSLPVMRTGRASLTVTAFFIRMGGKEPMHFLLAVHVAEVFMLATFRI